MSRHAHDPARGLGGSCPRPAARTPASRIQAHVIHDMDATLVLLQRQQSGIGAAAPGTGRVTGEATGTDTAAAT